jgi:NTE family protein
MLMSTELQPRPASLPARPPSIGLALGGGGARGIAHILMLEVFDELGIKPKVIAGTSIGALYGAAYASGMSAAEVRARTEETLARRFDLVRQLFAARSEPARKLLRLVPLRSPFLNPATLLELVLPGKVATDFADLEIPLKVVATDLASHEAAVLTEGPLRPSIAASIAIPVVFSPVVIGGRTLADGGLANPLPFDLIDGAADLTVAIDVGGTSTELELGPKPSAIEVVVQSLQILQKSITRERLRYRQPDIYIEVAVGRFAALEFYKFHEILAAAAPAKAALKRQLARVLGSETVELAVTPPPAVERPVLPRRRRFALRTRE